ncbi:prepilin-type N-terminal cleavage/methylation domain-containing protein [Exiguobacterium aurantiacum]|uniref:Prepilin-type N-terminal cleavage/methylation domain-containing protein n=1 Tax=Exiguobacterium aurantiacum TaxID=33987 RepID=A0ABY5FR99_9BACL|nr:prepilin-type N-terminal cleavage/methylation domain-containing protein [Exiguobacterium aurantiacum]UTT44139.1 prepilin-type N-terminal cleavage/methylation domain-containing protein [Exiguobacterium aurantiacum]
MQSSRVDAQKYAMGTCVSRRFEQGFTLLEVSFTLLLIPLFVGLAVHFLALGQAFYEQPREAVATTPQLIVRKLFDSRDCDVESGRLVGTYVRPDGTSWAWTLKQINQNLVMVGDEGGNLLFLRGIETYRVEPVGEGFRIQWIDATGPREKNVMCMRAGTL